MGIDSQTRSEQQNQHQRQHADDSCGLFPVQDPSDARFRLGLAERGQGKGGVFAGQRQKRLRIVAPLGGGKRRGRRFVARQLQIAPKQPPAQPDHRVEPVQAQAQKRQQLPHMIAVFDVRFLVQQHIALFKLG